MKLLVATQSSGKTREFQASLADTDLEVVFPADVGLAEFDVDETGKTLAENALLKAKAFHEKSGLPTLADDSGLMVKALGGDPGVRSKRYAPGTDHDRNIYLLDKMSDAQDRTAEFITILCLYVLVEGKPRVEYFEGSVVGRIGFAISEGNEGFGYDPLFIPDGYDKTFAELTVSEKQELSHRGRALEKFKRYIQKER